jgi:hypothetical protein
MKTYYALTNQLVWLKADNLLHKAEDFIIILDEENFVKIINQAIDLANNTILKKD